VLDAALDLLRRHGYGQMTMEGLAKAAGVSKQTIYRWWPSPAAVLMEVLNEYAIAHVPVEDRGSLELELRDFVRNTVAGLHEGTAPIVAALMAKAQLDAGFATAFREQFLARRRQAMRTLLERGRERGEVAADADLDLLVDIGFGTIWYRVLSRHAPLSRRFADELTDTLLALCATGQPSPVATRSGDRPPAPRARAARRA
jgi:AcrR family transcriptional regulator